MNHGFLLERMRKHLIAAQELAGKVEYTEGCSLSEAAHYVSSRTKDVIASLNETLDAYHRECALDALRGHDNEGIQY
tara:strand:+ start:1465 stop:1695 length:231 start_codon:yes stop_codon:yes gene_type:complete